MGLMKRVGGLVSANLNDLIDQCEDPEKMLRQSVREMETALGQLMDGAARAIAHHKLLARQLAEQQSAAEQRLKLAEAAVSRGDDATARHELKQRAECLQLIQAFSQQVISAEALGKRLRHQVSAMRLKLGEARRRLVAVSARNRAAAAQRRFLECLPRESYAGNCASFDHLCGRVEQSEAETEALLDLLGEPATINTFDAEVEAELCALKGNASHVAH